MKEYLNIRLGKALFTSMFKAYLFILVAIGLEKILINNEPSL